MAGRATASGAIIKVVDGAGAAEDHLRAKLPRQLTSFVGRERELTEVARALGSHRMVTLSGPGGAGKTRLALAVAERLVPEYDGRLLLVELADVADAELVASAVASAAGVRERPDIGVLASLTEEIGPTRVLVVLDNCEHVADACAELAVALLQACPRLHLLTTSRQPLGVPGELAWRLPPLATPTAAESPGPADLTRYESARLFLERARTFQPAFVLTAENAPAVASICELTDGIPLAIELAAGRLTTLSAEQIAAQLVDTSAVLSTTSRLLPPRQRTLRATIDGSYERLSPSEKVLFDRMSVFSGLVSLETVRGVCADAALPALEVLDNLASLIDKSLVQAEAASRELRYRLLDLLRQYAAEKLAERGEEEALRARHAAYFASMAETSAAEQERTRAPAWAQRLTDKRQNLRAAMEWSLRNDPELALRLAAGLSWLWHTQSNLAEGRRWLERALQAPAGDPALRARALHGAGQIVYRQGDCAAAQAFLTEALEIQRRLGDEAGTARTLRSLGLVMLSLSDYRHADQCLDEALAIQRRHDDRFEVARTLGSLALVAIAAGRYEAARLHCETCVGLARQTNDEWGLATSIGVQGELALEMGDLEAARSHLAVSIGVLARLRDVTSIAYRLEGFARLAAAASEPERALTLAGAAGAMWTRAGAVAVPHWRRRVEDSMARCRRGLPPAVAAAASARGAAMDLEEAIAYATDVSEQAARRGPRETGGPPWASARSQAAGLSAREWDVLALVMTGQSNRVIANRLSISQNTVNKHVARILDKLAARSRSQAIAIVLGLEPVE